MERYKYVTRFIIFAAILAVGAVSQGCGPKKPKPDPNYPSSGDSLNPDGSMGPGGITGEPLRPLSPAQESAGARDQSYTPVSALQNVYFDFDRSELREDAKAAIDNNVRWMKANPGNKVQIEGHCDERGTEEYNLALGERRATAVKNYMISLGVDGRKLFTISYGEELPIDPGHSEEAWAKNRRASFLAAAANF